MNKLTKRTAIFLSLLLTTAVADDYRYIDTSEDLRGSYNSESYTRNNTNSTIRYYKDSKNHKVQSPTYYNSAPSGATAQCRDGTYSFSHSILGTCSHHGGVRSWL